MDELREPNEARYREIAETLAEVRARLREAERRAGRAPGSARLIAVSKTRPADDVLAAAAAGQADFGENYAQELRDKRAAVGDARTPAGEAVRWHAIGPLQSNKVKYVAGSVALIHAVGSVSTAEEIDRRLGDQPAAVQPCLVQVNVAGEAGKQGVAAADLPALLDRFATLAHVRCDGLMLIPPLEANAAANRPRFAALRRLAETEQRRGRPHVDLRELSMGMSGDYETAIAEGATLVRVGTAIFGARSPRP